ncbi:MAG: hypothetical protein A2583_02750 [Bdellovibrionales bacterium RIFOXYD1_FULL_53_11]|nr:MAG: hypothetical protein A2583_02750 [Bdellovibrionales bacterium RIFOXYD1_FULL_53_11]
MTTWPTRATEKLLDPVKLIQGNHGPVLAWVGVIDPANNTGVEGIGEHSVDAAQAERSSPAFPPNPRAQSPLFRGNLLDLPWGMGSREHEIPHLAEEREPLRVRHDGLRLTMIQVARGSIVRPPTMLQLCPISTAHIFAQIVHVVFRVAEDDGQHELPLGAVLEREVGKAEIFELLGIEKVDDPSSIDGVASKSIRMPGDDSICLAMLDPPQHGVEYRPPRCLGALGFLADSEHSDILPR